MPRFVLLVALILLPAATASAQQADLALLDTTIAETTVPGLPFHYRVAFHNRSATPTTGVVVTITAPSTITTAPDTCAVSGNRAVCSVGGLAPGGVGIIALEMLAPDVSEQTFEVVAEITANEPDPAPANNRVVRRSRTYRTFLVTNTDDSGSGSLRAALEGANATCNSVYPCLVAFRIVANKEWHTIRVELRLPRVIAAQLLIDGTTQRAYLGDSNAAGPEIEITGTPAAGNGLEIHVPCNASITGLTINNFPGAAVVLLSPFGCNSGFRTMTGNYIGTDPTGMHAVPNERGVTIAMSTDALPFAITNNLISGNRRSGIFIDTAPRDMRIAQNVIGLNANLTAGLGNGASGIYVASPGVDITDNYIGFNEHFGVAIRGGVTNVSLLANSFQANHQMAIDYGLDGSVSSTPIPLPEITMVRFEDNMTIIEGMGVAGLGVSLYANDAPDESGYGEGQYYLGATPVDAEGRFILRHPGDWRGKWIAATQTRSVFETLLDGTRILVSRTTSEFSRAVEVR